MSTGKGARPDVDLAFGRELDARRHELDISLEEVSRRAGVSRTYLADIAAGRRGHSWPAQDLVDRVATALEVEPDYFTITRARAVLEEPTVIDVAYTKVKAVRKLRAKTTSTRSAPA